MQSASGVAALCGVRKLQFLNVLLPHLVTTFFFNPKFVVCTFEKELFETTGPANGKL